MKNISSKVYIYSLRDLDDNVFYVGQSKNPYARLGDHIMNSHLLKNNKDKIISEIYNSGFFPKLDILEQIDVDINNKKSIFNVSDRECYWISKFTNLSNIQKRIIKLKPEELPERCPFCIYCNERMQKGTSKKRFCSDKCRVYWHRKYPKGNVISATELASKLADNVKVVEIPVENQKTPPDGLKGIDLVIWKAENWK
jgi:hypothetical protein